MKPWVTIRNIFRSLKGSNRGVRLFDPFRVGIVLCRDPRVAAFGLTLGYYLRPLRGRKADRCRRFRQIRRVRTGSGSDWVLRLNVRLFDPYRVGIVLRRIPRVAAFGLTLGYYLCPLRGRKDIDGIVI